MINKLFYLQLAVIDLTGQKPMPQQKVTVAILDQAKLIKTRLLSAINEMAATVNVDWHDLNVDTLEADVVILDIHLLNGTGMALIRRLKSLPQPPVVIVFTAHTNAQSELMCWQAGADYFFDKACDFEKLTAVLEKQKWQTPHE
jgi:DNA-binding response OmpR family regulator